MRNIFILVSAVLISTAANAQQWGDVKGVNPVGYIGFPLDGKPLSSLQTADVLIDACNHGTCGFVGANIQNFAETSYVNSQFSSLDSQISSMKTNLSSFETAVGQLGNKWDAGIDRANQLAVISAAMKDAVPNDGDRFALRMNMASGNSQVAGSMSFSANVTDQVRFSVDYGRGQNQNMFSGGVNFSFN